MSTLHKRKLFIFIYNIDNLNESWPSLNRSSIICAENWAEAREKFRLQRNHDNIYNIREYSATPNTSKQLVKRYLFNYPLTEDGVWIIPYQELLLLNDKLSFTFLDAPPNVFKKVNKIHIDFTGVTLTIDVERIIDQVNTLRSLLGVTIEAINIPARQFKTLKSALLVNTL
jgi:hypothetical protein